MSKNERGDSKNNPKDKKPEKIPGQISAEQMAEASMKNQLDKPQSRERSGTVYTKSPKDKEQELQDIDRGQGYSAMPSLGSLTESDKKKTSEAIKAQDDLVKNAKPEKSMEDLSKEVGKKEGIKFSNLDQKVAEKAKEESLQAKRTQYRATGAEDRMRTKVGLAKRKESLGHESVKPNDNIQKESVTAPKKKNIIRRATHKASKRTRAATHNVSTRFDKVTEGARIKRSQTAPAKPEAAKIEAQQGLKNKIVNKVRQILGKEKKPENIAISGPSNFQHINAGNTGLKQSNVKATPEKDNLKRTEKYTRPAPKPPTQGVRQTNDPGKMTTKQVQEAQKDNAMKIAEQLKKRVSSKTMGSGSNGPPSTPKNPNMKPKGQDKGGRG